MLTSLPFTILVATLLGFLAGIGVGGGSLLILWLTLVLDYPHPQARILNLLFFLPSAIVATLFRWKQGTLNVNKVLPAIISGCIAAGIASCISANMNTALLKKLFGVILLGTGVRELLYKPKKKRE